MARPNKAPADQRTKRPIFRTSENESARIEQSAADAGLTVSDYLRGLVLNAKPRLVKASPERAALIKALGTLGNIRADINQILKDRFAHEYVPIERVDKVFTAIEDLADKILTELGQ